MRKTVTITLTLEEEKILNRVAREFRTTRAGALRVALREAGRKLDREETMSAHDWLKRYIPEKRGPVRKRSNALNVREEVLKIIQEKHARRSR